MTNDRRKVGGAPWLAVLMGTVLLVPGPADAQTRPEPRLMFSFFGGITTGSTLFDIPVQPLCVTDFQLNCLDQYDTLALRRSITSAPTVGMNATLYGSSNFGLTAEVVYIGLRTDDTCQLLFEHSSPGAFNRQVCNDITQRARTVSNVGITLGGAFRLASRSAVSPYVRLQGGIGIRSLSIVQMTGRFSSGGGTLERPVILDDTDTAVKPRFVGALGVMFGLGGGYQIRAELRDQLLRLERPTGPADELARVNKEGFWSHTPSLVFGIDILLEQKRGRRY
jgi:hypothetical protein